MLNFVDRYKLLYQFQNFRDSISCFEINRDQIVKHDEYDLFYFFNNVCGAAHGDLDSHGKVKEFPCFAWIADRLLGSDYHHKYVCYDTRNKKTKFYYSDIVIPPGMALNSLIITEDALDMCFKIFGHNERIK